MSLPRVTHCLYPECQNTARTRGLCHGHYQAARALVRRGAADEDDMQARGLMAPAGTPSGFPLSGSDLFKFQHPEENDSDA